MADFLISFGKTMAFEGTYSNDPDDTGSETYRGVSRKNYPNWTGWVIIDSYKSKPGFPATLDSDNNLLDQVRQFYKVNYWIKLSGDKILNQATADYLFDCSVNLGLNRTITFLQKSLNILTDNNLSEDGVFGPNTLNSLLNYLNNSKPTYLIKLLTIFRGNHYINIVTTNLSQRKFIRGWLHRV